MDSSNDSMSYYKKFIKITPKYLINSLGLIGSKNSVVID